MTLSVALPTLYNGCADIKRMYGLEYEVRLVESGADIYFNGILARQFTRDYLLRRFCEQKARIYLNTSAVRVLEGRIK